MSQLVFGIDLGTTNSVVAIAERGYSQVLPDPEGYPLIPSVVSFHPNGEVLSGRAGRERRLIDAKNTVFSVKRLIGRPFHSDEVRRAKERFPFELREGPTGGTLVAVRKETYTLSEISAFVLREVRRVAESALGKPCTRAVVTVPANFNELQRSATKAAGKIAGLDVLRILNEPTAAALAYGYGRGSRERIAVFDLGGGTFDVTILELAGEVFEVLATAGDTYLGGDDIDLLVANYMAEAFLAKHRYDPRRDIAAFERLRAAAEWAKCQLTTEQEVRLRVEELAYGQGGQSLDLTFELTRKQLEQMAEPLVRRAFDTCEDAMRIAGIRPTQLDNVILVGGSTRMPLVHQMAEAYFGKQPLATLDPDLVVAQGAAIQGHALAATTSATLGRVAIRKVVEQRQQKFKGAAEEINPAPLPQSNTLPGFKAPQQQAKGGDEEPTAARGISIPPEAGPAGKRASLPPPLPPAPPPIPSSLPAPRTAMSDLPVPDFAPSGSGQRAMGGIDLGAFGGGAPRPPPVPSGPVSFGKEARMPELRGPDLPPALEASERSGGNAPLLLDVTPHTLSIETVGGFCEPVIARNAPIPAEETRVFSTARDDQDKLQCRICQGESRKLGENQELGEITLEGLGKGARGKIKINVAFMLDADGTLAVTASDSATGRQQTVKIVLLAGVSDEEVQKAKARQEARP